MNFIETCRKGAGLPAFHRDCPVADPESGRWSMTQEKFAKFVGQVRTRYADVDSELTEARARISKLSDEKASMANKIAELRCKGYAIEAGQAVAKVAESLGLERSVVKKLADAASGGE